MLRHEISYRTHCVENALLSSGRNTTVYNKPGNNLGKHRYQNNWLELTSLKGHRPPFWIIFWHLIIKIERTNARSPGFYNELVIQTTPAPICGRQ